MAPYSFIQPSLSQVNMLTSEIDYGGRVEWWVLRDFYFNYKNLILSIFYIVTIEIDEYTMGVNNVIAVI